MTITIHEKIGLAQIFGEKLQEALDDEQLRAAIARNNAEGPHSEVCHSHDFCDANMVMDAAWREMFGQELDPTNQAECDIWNDAWAIAKAANFFWF